LAFTNQESGPPTGTTATTDLAPTQQGKRIKTGVTRILARGNATPTTHRKIAAVAQTGLPLHPSVEIEKSIDAHQPSVTTTARLVEAMESAALKGQLSDKVATNKIASAIMNVAVGAPCRDVIQDHLTIGLATTDTTTAVRLSDKIRIATKDHVTIEDTAIDDQIHVLRTIARTTIGATIARVMISGGTIIAPRLVLAMTTECAMTFAAMTAGVPRIATPMTVTEDLIDVANTTDLAVAATTTDVATIVDGTTIATRIDGRKTGATTTAASTTVAMMIAEEKTVAMMIAPQIVALTDEATTMGRPATDLHTEITATASITRAAARLSATQKSAAFNRQRLPISTPTNLTRQFGSTSLSPALRRTAAVSRMI